MHLVTNKIKLELNLIDTICQHIHIYLDKDKTLTFNDGETSLFKMQIPILSRAICKKGLCSLPFETN